MAPVLRADVNEFAVMTSSPVTHAKEKLAYNFYNITTTDEDAASTYVMTVIDGDPLDQFTVCASGFCSTSSTL